MSEKDFREFSVNEMRINSDQIKAWAKQTTNKLLQKLAIDVVEAAQAGLKTKCPIGGVYECEMCNNEDLDLCPTSEGVRRKWVA